MAAAIALARLVDLPEGIAHPVIACGQRLLLVRQGAEVAVLHGSCPHLSAPLGGTALDSNGELVCSAHGWRFDGRSGQRRYPLGPQGSTVGHLKHYPSMVQDGQVWLSPAA